MAPWPKQEVPLTSLTRYLKFCHMDTPCLSWPEDMICPGAGHAHDVVLTVPLPIINWQADNMAYSMPLSCVACVCSTLEWQLFSSLASKKLAKDQNPASSWVQLGGDRHLVFSPLATLPFLWPYVCPYQCFSQIWSSHGSRPGLYKFIQHWKDSKAFHSHLRIYY